MSESPNGCGSLYLALAASVDFNEHSEKIPALCGRRDLSLRVREQPGSERLGGDSAIRWRLPATQKRESTGTFAHTADRRIKSKSVFEVQFAHL